MTVPTPHIEAKAGDFAKTVLMPGDPLRAQFIAQTYLEHSVLVNNIRGIQGYTGFYQGTRISSPGSARAPILILHASMSCLAPSLPRRITAFCVRQTGLPGKLESN